ncbi:UNVERIFIED_CONTAM: hypothetical protein Sradi_5288800 [Sesamum radiatum]|uniref:Uncharacterized protein n=1 Tax=Sesamum radiatum TaxID=300843 RepID=A0AAW2LPI7_SESRA
MSEKKINYAKSAFIPGKKASLISQRIKSITGFTMKALPITHLGAPLYKGNKKKSLYVEQIDKVRAKIARWEHCHLSYGGRLHLIKIVLASMPIYLLQVLNPPGYSPSISKLFATDSRIWKRICTILTDAQANIFWSLGNDTISFWHDWWLPKGILANLVGTQCNLHIPVKWFCLNHEWDTHKLQQVVPLYIIDMIMKEPINTYQSDYLHWKLSKHSAFTTKSAWNKIRSQQPVQQFYRSLWSKLVILNILVCSWRLIQTGYPLMRNSNKREFYWFLNAFVVKRKKLSHIYFFTTLTLSKLGDTLLLNSRLISPIPMTSSFLSNPGKPESACANIDDKPKEGEDDIKSSCPLWPGRHACYNGWAKGRDPASGTKPHIIDVIPLLILWNIWNLQNDSKYEGVAFKASIIIHKTMIYLHNLQKSGLMKIEYAQGDLFAMNSLHIHLHPKTQWQKAIIVH